jgi:hypothetical protein
MGQLDSTRPWRWVGHQAGGQRGAAVGELPGARQARLPAGGRVEEDAVEERRDCFVSI